VAMLRLVSSERLESCDGSAKYQRMYVMCTLQQPTDKHYGT